MSIDKRNFVDVVGYPIVLDISGRRCVVVGGGGVAERKVEGLLAAGAAVAVVSPKLTEGLEARGERREIEIARRRYRRGDLEGASLAFVAVGDPRLSAAVAREGRRQGVWVNAADDPEHCDFFLPSVLRRGKLVIAIATGGASPALSRAVREEIERLLPTDYAALAETVAEVRRELKARGVKADASAWNRAIAAEMRHLTSNGGPQDARARLVSSLVKS